MLIENPILLALVSAIAGSVGTGLVGVFAGWWQNKTSLPLKVIRDQGKLQANNAKAWEKLIMIRKVLENAGHKIPDRDWTYEEIESED